MQKDQNRIQQQINNVVLSSISSHRSNRTILVDTKLNFGNPWKSVFSKLKITDMPHNFCHDFSERLLFPINKKVHGKLKNLPKFIDSDDFLPKNGAPLATGRFICVSSIQI